MANFGQVVREHRRLMALSQEDLAAKAGISARNLRDIERRLVSDPLGTVRAWQ